MLEALAATDLSQPTHLPGWDRLTVACHLRYGASAVLRMTGDALAGRETAYYPGVRSVERPGTLVPAAGESGPEVLSSWAAVAAELDSLWLGLPDDLWSTEAREPRDNPDLGDVTLSYLALARLTEVEVHGTDLGIGLPDWSSTFVAAALPVRVERLPLRYAAGAIGRWRLDPDDRDAAWLVEADGVAASTRPAVPGDDAATVAGSSRDLVALLLGRPTLRPLAGAGSFAAAFPGP